MRNQNWDTSRIKLHSDVEALLSRALQFRVQRDNLRKLAFRSTPGLTTPPTMAKPHNTRHCIHCSGNSCTQVVEVTQNHDAKRLQGSIITFAPESDRVRFKVHFSHLHFIFGSD
jgi:hypothetical protein